MPHPLRSRLTRTASSFIVAAGQELEPGDLAADVYDAGHPQDGSSSTSRASTALVSMIWLRHDVCKVPNAKPVYSTRSSDRTRVDPFHHRAAMMRGARDCYGPLRGAARSSTRLLATPCRPRKIRTLDHTACGCLQMREGRDDARLVGRSRKTTVPVGGTKARDNALHGGRPDARIGVMHCSVTTADILGAYYRTLGQQIGAARWTADGVLES